MSEIEEEQAHLALLVGKHQEQAQLFYSRVQILLVVYGFLFAAMGVVISSETLRSDVAYASLAILMLVGAAFSLTWSRVISESNDWIRFWEAKIIAFELRRKQQGAQWDFFRDRARSENELPQMAGPYSLDRMHRGLKVRWRGEKGAYQGGRIGGILQRIPDVMGIILLVLLVVVSAMWGCDTPLHESKAKADNAAQTSEVPPRADDR